jgi:hypothetical protein
MQSPVALLSVTTTHHGLGSTTLMDVSISCHTTGTHGAYGAAVRALMSILVWKRLELHCLVRVHFFTESQQMECCVWAYLILHTWNGTPVHQGVDVVHSNPLL